MARDERSDDAYRAFIRERFCDVESAKRPSDEEFTRFAAMLHYRRMDLSQPEHYAGLKQWVDARGADTVVLFLATSPHLFPQICAQLGAVGLNGANVRVVLEKPLGHDLASAQEINRVVSASFRESQALRIDHYLGKAAVQNLAALRFGNACSSHCGGARASPTSRSRLPRRWVWARAATSTTAPARCATWCRTMRCNC